MDNNDRHTLAWLVITTAPEGRKPLRLLFLDESDAAAAHKAFAGSQLIALGPVNDYTALESGHLGDEIFIKLIGCNLHFTVKREGREIKEHRPIRIDKDTTISLKGLRLVEHDAESIENLPTWLLKRMWDDIKYVAFMRVIAGFEGEAIHAELNRRGEGAYCAV